MKPTINTRPDAHKYPFAVWFLNNNKDWLWSASHATRQSAEREVAIWVNWGNPAKNITIVVAPRIDPRTAEKDAL